MRTSHLALIAIMSAVFFCGCLQDIMYPALASLVNATGSEFFYSLADPWFPACISLCGGVAFLVGTRKINPSWYLGIPLCTAFAITAISPLVDGILVIHDLSPPIYHPGILWTLLSQAAFFLLPLCAALFFWSQRPLERYSIVLAGVTLLMTLGSLAALYFSFFPYLVSAGLVPPPQPHYVDGHPVKTHGEGLLFLFFHFMVGLPVAGLCFLALAVLCWYSSLKHGSSVS